MTEQDTTQPLSTRRKILFTMISILFFLGIIFLVGEVIARIMYSPPAHYQKADVDAHFGWYTKSNDRQEGKQKDSAGNEYPVIYETSKNGFREWGDVNSKKPKIFFIGDSYVQSVEVSNDKLFYNLLKDSLQVEVFAFGQAGFGNFQQYLVLDKYFDEIKPDIVVLQTCDNDFIDNYHQLELESGYKVGLERPYLKLNGQTEYYKPVPKAQRIIAKSKFLSYLAFKMNVLQQKTNTASVIAEKKIAEQKRGYNHFDQSVKISDKIIEKFRKRIPSDVKFIGFSASLFNPQLGEFQQIFEKHQVPFYSEPAMAIQLAQKRKQVVNSDDGYHWNEAGHELIAKALLEILK